MIRRGTITLFHRDGYAVASKKYGTPALRNKIIDKWRHTYANGISGGYFQISPYSFHNRVGKDGKNLQHWDRGKYLKLEM